MKKTIYDFGGGESTFIPDKNERLIVVDILSKEQASRFIESSTGISEDEYEYIQADLNKEILLEEGDQVMLGAIVQYIDDVEQFIKNIHNSLKTGGEAIVCSSFLDMEDYHKYIDFTNMMLAYGFEGRNTFMDEEYNMDNEICIYLTKK
jgi:hypothetical protein